MWKLMYCAHDMTYDDGIFQKRPKTFSVEFPLGSSNCLFIARMRYVEYI